ncbi:hypothetical protein NBO_389g0003 [Nosema bombycis CQ1]|uniref:Uncharacterized protein n=1 Tax=Nosema bombycis (strain CQ1 / CVCC 102059) TaxID=578461 RepID=R0KQZ1_NOSB1|nr:hypothetical protein NBO_389g0003 [Nosema bombycis CQ1]|eukprot:EOB12632.1 hypothetical protein NBO_389g0003 [Nosema bombycis CQ1]
MVAQKKGDKKTDEKKIKKASLAQVVEHLNNNEEESKDVKNETSLKVKKSIKEKKKAEPKDLNSVKKEVKNNKASKKEDEADKKDNSKDIKVDKASVKDDKNEETVDVKTDETPEEKVDDDKSMENKANPITEIVPAEGSSAHQLVKVNESSSEHIDVEPVSFTEDEAASKESEEYSKKKIRQEQSAKKREEKKKKPAKKTETEKAPEKVEDFKNKRVKRATAVEEPVDAGKKLTRKERKDLKVKNKGAGPSSKEYVRMMKEGENKDLKEVPLDEGKGINQLPTRTKADAIAKKPLKKAKGEAAPRGRTRTAPKDKKKK